MPKRSRPGPSLVSAATGDLLFGTPWGAIAVYPPGATFGPRTTEDFEFVWILEGEAVWTCDGARHAAPPGTLILTRPGMREQCRWDPHRQTRHAFAHFFILRGLNRLPALNSWPTIR